jgi:hypothetical protein
LKKPHTLSENVGKRLKLFKTPHLTGKSLHFSLNVLKIHITLAKASISLNMYLKSLAIFENPHIN